MGSLDFNNLLTQESSIFGAHKPYPLQVPTHLESVNLRIGIQGNPDFRHDAELPDRHSAWLNYWTARPGESSRILSWLESLAHEYDGSPEFNVPNVLDFGALLCGDIRLSDRHVLAVLLAVEVTRLDWQLNVVQVLSGPRASAHRLKQCSLLSRKLAHLAEELEVCNVAYFLQQTALYIETTRPTSANSRKLSDLGDWLIRRVGRRRTGGPNVRMTCPCCGGLFMADVRQGKRQERCDRRKCGSRDES